MKNRAKLSLIYLLTTIASAEPPTLKDLTTNTSPPLPQKTIEETPKSDIQEYEKWAYICGLMPGREKWVVEPFLSTYIGTGAAIGAAISITILLAHIFLQDNGWIERNTIKDMIENFSQNKLDGILNGIPALALGAGTGALLGAATWGGVELYHKLIVKNRQRLEYYKSAEYILTTPEHLLPRELLPIIEEYYKDFNKLRLVYRAQQAIDWYKSISIACAIIWTNSVHQQQHLLHFKQDKAPTKDESC